MTGKATSLIPTVKRMLIDRLARDPDIREADVDVQYGRGLDPERELIACGASHVDRTPGPMRPGRTLRNEDAQFVLWIVACEPGQASEDAELRAFELLAIVENIVADDPTFDGDLPALGISNGLKIVTFDAGDADPNVEGWEGLIRVTLGYSARLE